MEDNERHVSYCNFLLNFLVYNILFKNKVQINELCVRKSASKRLCVQIFVYVFILHFRVVLFVLCVEIQSNDESFRA